MGGGNKLNEINQEEKTQSWEKCGCCGKLKPENDLEEIIIKIKKCRDCSPDNSVVEGIGSERPIMKTLGAKSIYRPSHDVAEVFGGEPE